MAALDRTQRVVGLDHRKIEVGRTVERGQPGHPEVRVHNVWRIGRPSLGQVSAELAHVREQLVLRDRHCRSGRHVLDRHAGV
jgi:hypothetical protein